MNMNDKWKNLGNRLSAAWSRPVKPTFKRPKEGDIFNEEKSVRWNREEVVRKQSLYDSECSRLKKAQNEEVAKVVDAIVTQIQADIKEASHCSLTRETALLLWESAYNRGHAYGFPDIYAAIEDYEELIIAVLKGGRRA
jgi:hypothetical protein